MRKAPKGPARIGDYLLFGSLARHRIASETAFDVPEKRSHNHRLSRWLAQPYKGMLLAGLKAH